MKKFYSIVAILLLLGSTLTAQNHMRNQKRNCNNDCKTKKEQTCKMGRKGNHQMKGCKMNPMVAKKFLKNAKELELSQEQINSIKEKSVQFKKIANTYKAEIKNLKLDKKAAMKSNNFEEAKTIIKKINAKKLKLQLKMIDTKEDCYNVLTKSQKKKLADLCSEKKDCKNECKK